jgi:hypothetical protein
MHKALQLVEVSSCPSCNDIDTNAAEVRQLLEVSHNSFIFHPELTLYVFFFHLAGFRGD